MESILNSASEDLPAGARPEAASSTATHACCPPVEELMDWLERQERQAGHAFDKHLQKCPRCAHLAELAAGHKNGIGIAEGIEDQDLLSIQPGLRTPALHANKNPRVSAPAKSKVQVEKAPATTWELLTGRPVHSRKS
ncbi:MAG: hypothetical protein ACREOO_04195 [bacterium]